MNKNILKRFHRLSKKFVVYVLDGHGYVEDGRDIFDDDLDSDSIAVASARAKEKGGKKKKKAVSANHTKGNLQFMISNMPSKKKEVCLHINSRNSCIILNILGCKIG